MGVSAIFKYFWRPYGTRDFLKGTFEPFESNRILFIAFRVKLRLKKTSSELICDFSHF